MRDGAHCYCLRIAVHKNEAMDRGHRWEDLNMACNCVFAHAAVRRMKSLQELLGSHRTGNPN
jgi:hypothetical protein